MNKHIKPSNNSFNFTLKPLSMIVFSLFAQQVYADSEAVKQQAIIKLGPALIQSAAKAQAAVTLPSVETTACVETTAGVETTSVETTQHQALKNGMLLVDASAALEVKAINLNGKPVNIPSNADRYNVKKETLLKADASDANPGGTSNAAKDSAKAYAKDKGTNNLPIGIDLKAVTVRAKRFHQIGPMPGLGLTKEEIPGNVQSITAKEIKESHALSLTDLMNTHLQSVNVNDYQSNPFQMDVTYRGFTASPQLGTAQGLSVFLDGIRVNEPFGDVVNWDMIPLNAINGLDVFPGSNPIFGLGTLGGALSMRTKSGFDTEEGTLEALGGSFNRKQFQGSVGGNNGVIAGFAAANIFMEDGWRDNSPSKVNQLFGKAEWRNEKLQLGLSALYAGNKLIGNGLLPMEAIARDPSKVFTSPDETKNRLFQFQLSGIWDVTDKFNITAQVYRRNSKRHALTTDINEQFGGLSTRRPNPGEKVAPGFADINKDGLPDYYLQDFNVAGDINGMPLDTNGVPLYVDNGSGVFIANAASNHTPLVGTDVLLQANPNQAMYDPAGNGTLIPFWVQADPFGNGTFNGVYPLGSGTMNGALPNKFYQFALSSWNTRHLISTGVNSYPDPRFGADHPAGGATNYYFGSDIATGNAQYGNYTDPSGFVHYLVLIPPIVADPQLLATASVDQRISKTLILPTIDPITGQPNAQFRNGADATSNGPFLPNSLSKTGVIDGTPTAIITKTEIDQISDGGAVQFNWNLDKHKLMVGGSVDMADASYTSAQLLGLLDANHRGYLDPANVGAEYAASTTPIGLNDFKGDSITKSLYASETWSPVETLHLNASARYNHTKVRNTLAINNVLGLKSANSFLNYYSPAVLCTGTLPDGTPDPASCPAAEVIPFSVSGLQNYGGLGGPETERFSYHSFNPAFGGTWQVTPATNVYANWSQGTRTPSVIELGCAYDGSPILSGHDPATGAPIYAPRTLYQRRFCSLPSTLSGDPYLKQVVSQTTEVGVRGYWGADIEWNATAYRSNLQDDIYFVSYAPDRSFFQNVGATRRQGLEFGVKGKAGKSHFSLNYSLTDATFQSNFQMASPNNSSASANMQDTSIKYDNILNGYTTTNNFGQIQVAPGNRMPGVPLHNINASFDYDVTDKWNLGFSVVLHSSAFVRGNENNQHQAGPATPIHTIVQQCGPGDPGYVGGYCPYDSPRPDFRYDGKTPGYAVFSFKTSYKLDKGLTLGLQVNNIFDRSYSSAGRLGINPFSPSMRGVVSPVTGFNYNSNDWQATNFIAPGAPRAAWLSLTYDFDVGK